MARVRPRAAEQAKLGDLDRHVGYLLRRAQLAVFADFSAAQRGTVAGPGQYSVLAVIERNPGLSQSQLGAALGIKRANLVAVIDEFERRDLVRRVPSPTDRRSNRLELTAAGRRVLRKASRYLEAHEARIIALLGLEGRDALLEQLRQLCRLADG